MGRNRQCEKHRHNTFRLIESIKETPILRFENLVLLPLKRLSMLDGLICSKVLCIEFR